jgi:hypothetical protein
MKCIKNDIRVDFGWGVFGLEIDFKDYFGIFFGFLRKVNL